MVFDEGVDTIRGFKVQFLSSDAENEQMAIDEIEEYCGENNLRRVGTYSLSVVQRGATRYYQAICEILKR